MKLKYVPLILVILVLPLANASLDKPNWSTGDYWNYSGSYVGSASMAFENQSLESSIDADVTLSIKVNDVVIKEIEGELVGCYLARVTSELDGEFTYKYGEQEFTGDFAFEVSGNTVFTTEELAVVETDIQLNISINIPNIPSTISTHTDYTPKLLVLIWVDHQLLPQFTLHLNARELQAAVNLRYMISRRIMFHSLAKSFQLTIQSSDGEKAKV